MALCFAARELIMVKMVSPVFGNLLLIMGDGKIFRFDK